MTLVRLKGLQKQIGIRTKLGTWGGVGSDLKRKAKGIGTTSSRKIKLSRD